MDVLKQSSLTKYIRGIKALPSEIFNWHVFTTVIAFALAGCPKGWDEGSASSITQLRSFHREYHLDGEANNETISNIVSFVNIGAGVGAFLSFFLIDTIGRLWSLRLYQALYAVGSLVSCFSYGNHGALYFGRILAGLGIGACTVVGPMTIAEVAPKTIRGLMTLWCNVGMLGAQSLGVFTVYGCNLHISASKTLQYQVPWFVQTFVPAITVMLSFLSVESPRWLALKGRKKDAVDTLIKLRGLPADHPNLNEEMSQLEAQADDEQQQFHDSTYWTIIKETFTVRSNLRRVQLTIVAYILAQFSGANSITNYLPTIFGLIGIKGTDAKVYSTGIYAIVKLVCCVVASLVFVDVLGRRRPLMIGITVQAACHSYLAGYLRYFIPNPEGMSVGASDFTIVVIYIHAFGWAVGLYTLPYLFVAELWPNRIRSFGGALSQSFHWLFYFAITKATPSILNGMNTWGAFVFFVAWCIIALVYTVFFIPETSGLILEEIDVIFQRPIHRMRQYLKEEARNDSSDDPETLERKASSGHVQIVERRAD